MCPYWFKKIKWQPAFAEPLLCPWSFTVFILGKLVMFLHSHIQETTLEELAIDYRSQSSQINSWSSVLSGRVGVCPKFQGAWHRQQNQRVSKTGSQQDKMLKWSTSARRKENTTANRRSSKAGRPWGFNVVKEGFENNGRQVKGQNRYM